MIGTIRPVETRAVDVEAHSLTDVHTVLEQQRPDGFELTDAPVRMSNGTTALTATGVFARRDGARDIEGPNLAVLRGMAPDGWALVSVRAQ